MMSYLEKATPRVHNKHIEESILPVQLMTSLIIQRKMGVLYDIPFYRGI